MEHIHNIEIKNFKSIRHAVISDCRRINVFVGPPNVGKSNILEGLSLAQVAAGEKLYPDLRMFCRYQKIAELFFEANFKEDAEVLLNKKWGVKLIYTSNNNNNNKPYTLNGYHVDSEGNSLNDRHWANSFLKELNILKYKFTNVRGNTKPWDSINLQSPHGDNLFELLSVNKTIREEINALLKSSNFVLLIDKTENVIRLQRNLKDNTVFQVSYNLIADTLQRLIFYKAAIYSNENAVLLIEEPESHLYEPYILDITNAIKYDKSNNQYFIVTHNQYFIDELLRDEESRNETNIYMVGLENGETAVRMLKQQNNEDVFNYGLNVFFNYDNLWKENA